MIAKNRFKKNPLMPAVTINGEQKNLEQIRQKSDEPQKTTHTFRAAPPAPGANVNRNGSLFLQSKKHPQLPTLFPGLSVQDQ